MPITSVGGRKRFTTGTPSVVPVDSTTQQLLIAASSKNAYVVSNPSNIRGLWVKPDDNTATKQGVLVEAGGRFFVPANTEMSIYAIMDTGGSVDIAILELS